MCSTMPQAIQRFPMRRQQTNSTASRNSKAIVRWASTLPKPYLGSQSRRQQVVKPPAFKVLLRTNIQTGAASFLRPSNGVGSPCPLITRQGSCNPRRNTSRCSRYCADPRLRHLTAELYPEIDPTGNLAPTRIGPNVKKEPLRRTAELHALLQMIQLIENVYFKLELEKYSAHPMNRGWLNLFHRWTSAPTFRRYWPHLRSEFSREFIHFCECRLSVGEVGAILVPLPVGYREGVLRPLLLECESQGTMYRRIIQMWYDNPLAPGRGWTIFPEALSSELKRGTNPPTHAGRLDFDLGDSSQCLRNVHLATRCLPRHGAWKCGGRGRIRRASVSFLASSIPDRGAWRGCG